MIIHFSRAALMDALISQDNVSECENVQMEQRAGETARRSNIYKGFENGTDEYKWRMTGLTRSNRFFSTSATS